MLKRLRVDNFKSLINVVFEPSHINILTGRNNSGKTTLCQAIEFLRLSAYYPIAEAAGYATGDIWNLTNAYLKKDVVSFECECELAVENVVYRYTYYLSFGAKSQPAPGTFERECAVHEERLIISGGVFGSETMLLDNTAGDVRLLHEGKYFRKEKEEYVDTTAPANITMLNRLYDLQHNKYANAFKKHLISWLYYDLDVTKLRSVEAKQSGLILNRDGSNLSHVLFQLKNYDESLYRGFVDIVKEIEPKLEVLNFMPPAQESVFMSLTDSQNNRFSVSSISNGTLRFMAIAYVVLTSSAWAEATTFPPPLVVIEEPENGIYVGHLKRLMELVKPIAGQPNPQFIFSSHSPYFIDLFDGYLEGVFVTRSDKTHTDLMKPGVAKLEPLLQEFDLGEAHFRELLG